MCPMRKEASLQYVIATKPGRTVTKPKNAVQKFAQVRDDDKFKFVTDVNQATVFNAASELLYAAGRRAQELENEPTHDLTWAEVQRSGVSISRILNGD